MLATLPHRHHWLSLCAALALAGCSLAPTLQTPEAPTPAAFKELAPWTQAQPADQLPRGAWWTLYGDAQLNALEQQLGENSPDLAAALALLDESADGSWGIPTATRAEVRKALRKSSAVPLPEIGDVLAALDAMPGLDEPPGARGRAALEAAVEAAFRELPPEARWTEGIGWSVKSSEAKRRLSAADKRLRSANDRADSFDRIDAAMTAAVAAYDRWGKERDASGKAALAAELGANAARLRDLAEKEGDRWTPGLLEKTREISRLLEAKARE